MKGAAMMTARLVAGRHFRWHVDRPAGADQRATGARPGNARRGRGGVLRCRHGRARSLITLVIVASARRDSIAWHVPPLWMFVVGGCLGAVFVTCALVLTPKLGAGGHHGLHRRRPVARRRCSSIAWATSTSPCASCTLGRMAGAVLLLAGALLHPPLLMRTDLFDFDLPEERIALHPVSPRDAARMLVVPAGDVAFEDRGVRDLPELLRAGDALVFNDTRVIPAALGRRAPARRARRQHRRDADRAARTTRRWRALARPAKRLQAATGCASATTAGVPAGALDATVAASGEAGEVELRFRSVRGRPRRRRSPRVGEMPLPPYIAGKRAVEDARPRRLPDDVRRARGRRRGADGGAALHAGADGGARRRAASRVTS